MERGCAKICVRSGLRRWLAAGLLVFACAGAHAAPRLRASALDDDAPFRRFLWVTRWDYRTKHDIERIFYNAASARFTDVLFQVRGEGTVFFKSPHEPWAWELTSKYPEQGVGVNPGWDPLATAIKEARRRGVRIHAYLNVMPVWAQKVDPPKGKGQIYADNKSWLMVHESGRRMTPNGFYACVDPGLPEVRQHLAKLFGDLVKNYDVDGVHLDYIRYPHERGDLSHHPRVVKDFKDWYGVSPSQDPEKWAAYKRKQVTQTVAEIRKAINAARSGVELSAAVFADPAIARTKACQEPELWLEKGYVDAVAPMVYVEEMGQFREFLSRWETAKCEDRVWVGMRALPKNTVLNSQIETTVKKGFGGVAVFCYEDLFRGHQQQKRSVQVYQKFVAFKGNAAPERSTPPGTRLVEFPEGEVKELPSDRAPQQVLAAGFAPGNRDENDPPPAKSKRRSPSLKIKVSN
jgi:uncharacterized lipoprotein YddW (UPF0748 family)